MWANLTTGAWCWYNNDSAQGALYGKLYNWYAVHDPRGLAPTGWHIPSAAEWDTLSARLGDNAGNKLKDTIGWIYSTKYVTNSTGFTALPGGIRYTFKISYSHDYSSRFNAASIRGYWWSSTESGIDSAWYRELITQNPNIRIGAKPKQYGLSIRCIKD